MESPVSWVSTRQTDGLGNERLRSLAVQNGPRLMRATANNNEVQSHFPPASSFALTQISLASSSRKPPPPPPPKKASLSRLAFPSNSSSPGQSQVTPFRSPGSTLHATEQSESSPPPLPPRRPKTLSRVNHDPQSPPRLPPRPLPAPPVMSPPATPPRIARTESNTSSNSNASSPPARNTPPSDTNLTQSPSPRTPQASDPKKPKILCAECSKIDFVQFSQAPTTPQSLSSQPTEPSIHLIDLKHLLTKRNTCNLCAFLFRALCIPAHDPLRDAELQESILKDAKLQSLCSKEPSNPNWVSFPAWAENRERFRIKAEAKWPFGHSYDDVNVKFIKPASAGGGGGNGENGGDDDREVDFEEAEGNERFEATAISQGTKAGLAAGKHFDGNGERAKVYGWAMEVMPDMGVINAMTRKGVPAVVRVVVYGRGDAKRGGVLDVTVFGCAKARGREIKTLSAFSVRVASPVPLVAVPGENMRYGRIVDGRGVDLGLCRQWVANCCSEHGVMCDAPRWSANLERPAGIRFRLINVVDGSIVERDPKRHPYAALSYVWGHASFHSGILVLSRDNRRSLSVPRALNRFNVGRTILDAMHVVRRLGLQYLWADRLCIIQDCDTDKAQQISQMDRIYGSALLTIVSASGAHLDSPITGASTSREISQLAEPVTSDPPVNVLLPMINGLYPKLNPWVSRAWTLQEKLLSKRLLIFHDGLVDFRCAHGTMHEDMNALDAGTRIPAVGWLSLSNTDLFSNVTVQKYGDASGPRLLRSSTFADYAALIEEYTPRQMSNPSDAVNAVMGLLKILFTNQQSRNSKPLLNGLPEQFLDQALHWNCAAKEDVDLCLKKGQQFPTWSWAAWEAATEESSKDPGKQPVGGVRYEATFHVQTDSRGRLQKVIHKTSSSKFSQQPQERLRPLLRWYTVTDPASPGGNPQIRPLNSTGLGLALSPSTDVTAWHSATSKALNLQQPCLPASQTHKPNDWCRNLRPNYHLITTTLVSQFTLGPTRPRTETLWRKGRGDDDGNLHVSRELHIGETPILDGNGDEIGRVVLPSAGATETTSSTGIGVSTILNTQDRNRNGSASHNFILLSEAQFFGDEESVEVMGEYPLFNIMMVRWVDPGVKVGGGSQVPRFAERVALGRVTKEGWWGSRWREEVVVLG